MVTTCSGCLQFLLDLLGKDLAQFDTPLVEGIDVPHSTLGEGEVLIVSNEGTERGGSDLLGEDRGGWAVTQECLVRHQVVGGALGLDLLRSLSDHQGLGLSKEVGGKHALVFAALDGVM